MTSLGRGVCRRSARPCAVGRTRDALSTGANMVGRSTNTFALRDERAPVVPLDSHWEATTLGAAHRADRGAPRSSVERQTERLLRTQHLLPPFA